TSAFVLPSHSSPYSVYTGSWPGPNACGMAISTLPDGTLSNVSQSWKYGSKSAIHGMTFGRNLYSADLSGDVLWTHKVNSNGTVEAVASYPMPEAGMHPRHIAAHPNGNYVYVVMEAGNEVVAYSVNSTTGIIETDVGTYSLIPNRNALKDYWSAEVMISPSTKLLWATARAMQDSNNTGFISCFNLDLGGNITDQIFRLPTTTTGGIANAVSPASWSDEFMALTDVPRGYVQIWQLVKGTDVAPGMVQGRDGWTSANMVAQVDIKDGGCCANAIWYD
ncbi:3-carboxy-cis,cis-mucoante lactonizing enzyme, partial [Mollisia scopiformis]